MNFTNRYVAKLNFIPHYKGVAYSIISDYYLKKLDLDKAISYSDSSLIYLKDKTKYTSLNIKAQALLFAGNKVEAKEILFRLLKDKDLSIRNKFLANRSLSNIYVQDSNFDSAYIYLNVLKSIYEKENNEEYKANTLDIQFMLYYKLDKQDSVLLVCKDIEKYRIKADEKDNLAKLYGNMGSVYMDYKKYDESLMYYEKCLKIKNQLGSKDIGYVYYNMSNVFFYTNEQEKVNIYLKKAIESYRVFL